MSSERRILRVNHEIYNGSGEVSWIFSLSYVNGQSYRSRDPKLGMCMGGIPQFQRYLIVYEGLLASIDCKSAKPLSWAAKGWAYGVAEKGSDWLGS